jgi:hypothetical protein
MPAAPPVLIALIDWSPEVRWGLHMSFVSLVKGQHWGNHSVGPQAVHEALAHAYCTSVIYHHSFTTDHRLPCSTQLAFQFQCSLIKINH